MLPPIVHICAGQARGTGLTAAVDLLAAESQGTYPGASAFARTFKRVIGHPPGHYRATIQEAR